MVKRDTFKKFRPLFTFTIPCIFTSFDLITCTQSTCIPFFQGREWMRIYSYMFMTLPNKNTLKPIARSYLQNLHCNSQRKLQWDCLFLCICFYLHWDTKRRYIGYREFLTTMRLSCLSLSQRISIHSLVNVVLTLVVTYVCVVTLKYKRLTLVEKLTWCHESPDMWDWQWWHVCEVLECL